MFGNETFSFSLLSLSIICAPALADSISSPDSIRIQHCQEHQLTEPGQCLTITLHDESAYDVIMQFGKADPADWDWPNLESYHSYPELTDPAGHTGEPRKNQLLKFLQASCEGQQLYRCFQERFAYPDRTYLVFGFNHSEKRLARSLLNTVIDVKKSTEGSPTNSTEGGPTNSTEGGSTNSTEGGPTRSDLEKQLGSNGISAIIGLSVTTVVAGVACLLCGFSIGWKYSRRLSDSSVRQEDGRFTTITRRHGYQVNRNPQQPQTLPSQNTSSHIQVSDDSPLHSTLHYQPSLTSLPSTQNDPSQTVTASYFKQERRPPAPSQQLANTPLHYVNLLPLNPPSQESHEFPGSAPPLHFHTEHPPNAKETAL